MHVGIFTQIPPTKNKQNTLIIKLEEKISKEGGGRFPLEIKDNEE